MSTSFLAPRDIINPICPLYFKRNMLEFLDKRQVASRIQKFRKIYNFCLFYFHNSFFANRILLKAIAITKV